MSIKVLSVFGTRAEATKMVPLVLALSECSQIESRVCVSSQHRELLDQVLDAFDIRPDYDLNVMTARQSLTEVTTRVLTGLEPILADAKPDLLLVHGDTATTAAAALAAFYAKISIGHVEAGLRTYDKYRPYPEEINRKLTTALSDMHFAPTKLTQENLLKENIPADSIFVTGNTAIDLIRYTKSDSYRFKNAALNGLDPSERIIFMTAHRNENRGKPMENICHAVIRLIRDFPDILLVLPLHPNGAMAEPAMKLFAGNDRIILTEPLDIFDTHNLMKKSYLMMTDSGGIQEEAPAFNLPTVVLREVTERSEGLDAGTLILAGVVEESIYQKTANLLTDSAEYKQMALAQNPFGDGQASKRIIDAIVSRFG